MSILPGAALANARATMARLFLPDTCVLIHVTQADNVGGGYSENDDNTETVACHVGTPATALSAAERQAGGPVLPEAPFLVRLPHDTTVDANDRIQHAGRMLEVVAVLGPKSNELVRRVACRQVTGG